jgi:hypothetical protein
MVLTVMDIGPLSYHKVQLSMWDDSDLDCDPMKICLSSTQTEKLIEDLNKCLSDKTPKMQPNLQQPLTPKELFALATLPPDICEAIQKLLIQKRNITMDQLPKSDGSWNAYTIKEVFEQKGWKVAVDVPGYNESYSTTLVFSY